MPSSRTATSLVVPRHGDSSVLVVEDREVPVPGPGHLRVKVDAAGVNFIEIYQREGVYPGQTPFVLGAEGAGVVDAVGEGVGFAPGDRVAWAMGPGTAAEYVDLDAEHAVPIPDEVDTETAAAAMLQGITAHYLVNSTFTVQPEHVVLAHALAGGVGQLLTQLVKATGATLIGTAGGPEKVALAQGLGRRPCHRLRGAGRHRRPVRQVRELTGGRGVDVVYDGVGKSTFDASMASLRPRGTMVLYGGASGQVPPFDIQRLNAAGRST